MRKKITLAAVMFICVCCLLTGWGSCAVHAESGSAGSAFYGNVKLLKQEDDNYVMQVTVDNKGEDFYGTVQLVFTARSDSVNCAYNVEMTLPAQSTKQFTVTVTGRAVDTAKDQCVLNFLDEKGRLLQTISLKNVFGNTLSGVPVGILSDNYAGLTYMDAGGMDFYIRGNEYPLHLIQLDRDNLRVYLDGLYFLVIDRFNVATLAQEDIEAIQEWVKDGGWLIIGTGAYAEQTLSGFDGDFLQIIPVGIAEPGEDNQILDNVDRYGYYYGYIAAEVDFTQMTFAQLSYADPAVYYNEGSQTNPAIYRTVGDGAVAIYFFALEDGELQKLDDYSIQYIYEEVMRQSGSYSSYNTYSTMESLGQRALAYIDARNTDVDFSLLKLLIFLYVVLVGPILYLILRKCKKREWYWVGVPVLGLLFILGVFIFGQGSRVNETKVYSVTAQQIDSHRADTYFLAYHSGLKPWKMLLADCFEMAGPGWNGYDGKYVQNMGDYFYTVDYDSKGLAIGLKPQENFESGYLYAQGKAQDRGTISGVGIVISDTYGLLSGIVTNETDCDLAYMAVWPERGIFIFEDVKAGETLDLLQAMKDGRCVYQDDAMEDVHDLFYGGLISFYGNSADTRYEGDQMAALLTGLGIAREDMPRSGTYGVVAGLVKDYDRAVVSRCNEISYGCLYTYTEMEAY